MDIPIYMKFYPFDCLNPEQVELNGSRPVLVERGPYTFLEKRVKEIIGFEEDNKFVVYREQKFFHFVPELSEGTLDDEINALNIPVVVRTQFECSNSNVTIKLIVVNRQQRPALLRKRRHQTSAR